MSLTVKSSPESNYRLLSVNDDFRKRLLQGPKYCVMRMCESARRHATQKTAVGTTGNVVLKKDYPKCNIIREIPSTRRGIGK